VVPKGHDPIKPIPANNTNPIAPTQVVKPAEDEKTKVWQIIGLVSILLIVMLVTAYTVMKCRKKCRHQNDLSE